MPMYLLHNRQGQPCGIHFLMISLQLLSVKNVKKLQSPGNEKIILPWKTLKKVLNMNIN